MCISKMPKGKKVEKNEEKEGKKYFSRKFFTFFFFFCAISELHTSACMDMYLFSTLCRARSCGWFCLVMISTQNQREVRYSIISFFDFYSHFLFYINDSISVVKFNTQIY